MPPRTEEIHLYLVVAPNQPFGFQYHKLIFRRAKELRNASGEMPCHALGTTAERTSPVPTWLRDAKSRNQTMQSGARLAPPTLEAGFCRNKRDLCKSFV